MNMNNVWRYKFIEQDGDECHGLVIAQTHNEAQQTVYASLSSKNIYPALDSVEVWKITEDDSHIYDSKCPNFIEFCNQGGFEMEQKIEFNDFVRYVLNNITDKRCIECNSALLTAQGAKHSYECWFCERLYYPADKFSKKTTVDVPIKDMEFDRLVEMATEKGLEDSFDRNPFTHDNYWDCECDEKYIHAKADRLTCPVCSVSEENSPDSRVSEVLMGGHFFKVLFVVEFDETEHPNVYWGNRIPSIAEAIEFMQEIGHQSIIDDYEKMTNVFEIEDLKQAAGLWDMEKVNKQPHFMRSK